VGNDNDHKIFTAFVNKIQLLQNRKDFRSVLHNVFLKARM